MPGDAAASAVRTAETRGRTDIRPPNCFVMVEATGPDASADALPGGALEPAGTSLPIERGTYRLEYERTKTAFAP